MDLRHLRAVVAVGDHRHFGRAAAELGLAQPFVSQTVKALERELGVELFERDTRNVRPTPAGEVFVAEARTALAAVERARSRAQAAARGEIGNLAIGIVGSAMAHPLPTLLRAYRARYPHVTLHFAEGPTATQLERLRTGTLDVGFVRPPLPGAAHDEFDVHVVSREPLVGVLPKGHRLAGRERIPVRALAGEPFVLFPRHLGTGLYDTINDLCRRAGFEPRPGQEAAQMQTIVGLVAAGCGVSIVPASVARLAHPEVSFVGLGSAAKPVELAVVAPKRHGSVLVEQFVTVVRQLTDSRRR